MESRVVICGDRLLQNKSHQDNLFLFKTTFKVHVLYFLGNNILLSSMMISLSLFASVTCFA